MQFFLSNECFHHITGFFMHRAQPRPIIIRQFGQGRLNEMTLLAHVY